MILIISFLFCEVNYILPTKFNNSIIAKLNKPNTYKHMSTVVKIKKNGITTWKIAQQIYINNHLPHLVMTISVPNLWNLSHNSLVSRVTLGSSTIPSSSGIMERRGLRRWDDWDKISSADPLKEGPREPGNFWNKL